MQTGQHIEAAQQFLDDASMLESAGSNMGAGEMIWGAAIQVLEAIDHIRTGNATGSLSTNGRRRLVNSVISDGVNRYNRIQNELHAHFYSGHLLPSEFADSMRRGRDCVAQLLAIALSSHAEPNEV